ncbi:Hypothetical protein NTJ_14630 [Nesidiocoris tenuis]|uniref:PHD-type domain-containing protein n=1 Tax=Nesidiocoris tenuis TaxID=355587 RepID=A0ABN7BBS1_9HEMI|nr:Hypothetical protein NTJ_14630 [Nesidiocoris tenuis]
MVFRTNYRSPNAGDPEKRFVLSIPKEFSYQGDPPDWIMELYSAPLKAGWKRMIVERRHLAGTKRNADVYYLSPDGYKFRSRQEIGQYLLDQNISEFEAAHNFSFRSRPLGGQCARFEIYKKAQPISDAKKESKDQEGNKKANSLGQIGSVKSLAPKSEEQRKKQKIQSPAPVKKKIKEDRVYCICDGDISGLMVKCDYSECPLQWYHLKCLKIPSAPVGKWYCPICRGDDSTQLNIAYVQDFR